jgi:hypothetical protein
MAAIQGIVRASSRNYIVQTDTVTKNALSALSTISAQLATAPINFFNELVFAASSRSQTEQYHITRLRNTHAQYMQQLDILSNNTQRLNLLIEITNPSIMSTLFASIARIREHSRNVLSGAEQLTVDVAQARANSSLLLTPQLLDEFIENSTAVTFRSSLLQLRNSYLLLLSAVRDSARLIAAHGSMHEILQRSYTRDVVKRNTSLNNFVTSYTRVRNTLLTSVVTYRQTAQSGFTNFIQRVRQLFDDTIVRPRFEQVQLPLITAFADVVTREVYNLTFFEQSFDTMKDSIVNLYTTETNDLFDKDSQLRDIILNLLREKYARSYASCLNELVSEAQAGLNSNTGKYSFCLDERTSGITIVIPSTSTWLSVIRDNVNFILQQFSSCLNGPSTVAGRTAISDCIQSVIFNFNF